METVTRDELVKRIKENKAVVFSVKSLRTGNTIRYNTKRKSRGAIWVYEDGYIGWLRTVRRKFSIVRGEDVANDKLPVIKAFQWVLDATEAQQAQMEITIYNECVYCGEALTTPETEKAGLCPKCAEIFGA